MVQLPRYVALKSKYNANYLRYVNEASPVQTFVQYSGESISTPYTKFEVEPAKSDPSLVNLRCCYNNKYWVSSSSDPRFIIAGSDKSQEDKSQWTCTLFEPSYDSANQAYRFRHVYRGFNVCLWRDTTAYQNCLITQQSTPDPNLCDLCTITDWETLLPLPNYVAFKGLDGYYLRFFEIYVGLRFPSPTFLVFDTTDIGEDGVVMRTFTTKDGSIYITPNNSTKCWKLSRESCDICVDSGDTTGSDPTTLFWATKLDTNTIALRNLSNYNFATRTPFPALNVDGLRADSRTIEQASHLQMIEPLISREIYDVCFRPGDARIYDQTVLVMATGTATNDTQVPNTVTLNLKYTDTTSSTWSSSVSMKVGISAKFEAGIPLIDKGEITISGEFSNSSRSCAHFGMIPRF